MRSVQRARLKAVAGRLGRYRRLGRRAAGRLVRTGAAPAMRYGVGVCGATDTAVRAARRFSCAVAGEMRGRSSFARLQLAAFDVGTLMATGPTVEWAKAVWEGLVGRDDLRAAWRNAIVTVGLASRPFQAAAGPAGATVASARRLGWKMPSPFDFVDGRGERISLDHVCPCGLAACKGRPHEGRCCSVVAGCPYRRDPGFGALARPPCIKGIARKPGRRIPTCAGGGWLVDPIEALRGRR